MLWWASHHRWHHKYSDTPEGRPLGEAARASGTRTSAGSCGTEWDETDRTHGRRPGEVSRAARARPIQRCHILPTVALALAFLFLGGAHALVWGYFVSTVLLWHGSFSINSLAHLFGKRRYATSDDSRNNWALALLTTGEGWHNNHHHYQSSANQGFRWWEIDVTYYVLRLLALLGLIWDLRRPPREVVEDAAVGRRRLGRVAA